MHTSVRGVLFSVLLIALLSGLIPHFLSAAPPQYFQTGLIVPSGLNGPSGFEIAPDGRIFILERTGTIKVVKNGSLLSTPFADLPSVATGDRGLIGLAFDPDFTNNHYVYFYYTGLDLLNRVVRFDASGDVGTNGPVILYETSSPSTQFHVGGSIRFGLDGKMYFAVGDNGYPPNAQNLSNPHGKLLRINKDGTIPTDNPFVNTPGALPEIWAYGFRNPWRFQFDSVTGKLYDGDVGEATWEEVNEIVKGGNYGWPTAEGVCAGCSFINPIYTYNHDNQSSAVTAGPVYRGSMFPDEYQGNFFFGDYARGFIRRIIFADSGQVASVEDFDTNAGSVVDLKVAPDGSMYYLTYIPGRLYRVQYSIGNSQPVANATADTTKGVPPLTVHFSSSGSYDPDGDPLQYQWDFGDGTTATTSHPTKTYNQAGTYTVELRISDGQNTTLAIPLVIQVGVPPSITIGEPYDGQVYQAGDTITYQASAVDGAGFDLVDGRITTEVVFHHDTHIHPFLGPIVSNSGQFTIPLSGESDPDTWYELIFTATDEAGLSSKKSVSIQPRKTTYTITTSPLTNLQVLLDGQPITTPHTIEGVVGFQREVSAPALQVHNGTPYGFDHWSDGGAATHVVTVTTSPITHTAFYSQRVPFTGEYFNNLDLSGTPDVVRLDPAIDFPWNDNSPDPAIGFDNFSVRWRKVEPFTAGRYEFTTKTDDGVRLFIDGQLLIDQWHDQGTVPYQATVDLTAGDHEIVMEYFEHGGGAIAHLDWKFVGATAPSGFIAQYYGNMQLQGTPVVTRTDPVIDFVWNEGTPDPAMPVDHFSVRWSQAYQFDASPYVFTLTADDGIRLKIDGVTVLEKWIDQPSTTYMVQHDMTAGTHDIVVEYYENGGGAVAKVSWVKGDIAPPPPTNTYQGEYWNVAAWPAIPGIPATPANLTRSDATIDFGWNDAAPDPGLTLDHFIARWTKRHTFAAGTYRFTTTTDDGVRVYIDNQLLIDAWHDQAVTTVTADKTLSAGPHDIRIEYYENTGGAIARFSFNQVAGGSTPNTFTADYFANQTFSGTPVLTRQEAKIDYVWNEGSPDPAVPVDHFSARWVKTDNFSAGNYVFMLQADDGIRFWVDDQLLVDDWTDHAMRTYTPFIELTAGEHTLKVEYYENGGGAVAILKP